MKSTQDTETVHETAAETCGIMFQLDAKRPSANATVDEPESHPVHHRSDPA